MKLVLILSLMATFLTVKVEGGTIREKRGICDRDIDNLSACVEKFVSYEKPLMLPFYPQSF